jgi:hypothetical protein
MSYLNQSFRLKETTPQCGGVYSTADLSVLLDAKPPRLARAIAALCGAGLLKKVRRGLYADMLNGYRPEIVGQRWLGPCYLSTESALSHYGLCHTAISAYTFVTPRLIPSAESAKRTFDGHSFIYRHLSRHLYFGYRCQEGVALALPEKAAVDFLYFSRKKPRSAMAPEDIDFSRLDEAVFRRFLRAYRQRGFRACALSFLEGSGRD